MAALTLIVRLSIRRIKFEFRRRRLCASVLVCANENEHLFMREFVIDVRLDPKIRKQFRSFRLIRKISA